MKKSKFIGLAATILLTLASSSVTGTVLAADSEVGVQDNNGIITSGSVVATKPANGVSNDDNDASNWKLEDLKGVATADSEAPLYSDDGNQISGRSVAAQSAWSVDGCKRNVRTGERRFRVSAHEWISENDAGFKKNQLVVDTKVGHLTNIQDITGGKVVMVLNPGRAHALFKSDGTLSNRQLAGDTSWRADKMAYAPDDQETPFFRVSTDEWLRWDQDGSVYYGFTPDHI